MNERLGTICVYLTAQGNADDVVRGIKLPATVGFTPKGVSFVGAASGSVTAASIDLKDGGSEITGATALDITTVAGDYAECTAYTAIGAGSVITFDVNITGGGSITGILTIFGWWDEA